MTEKHSIDSNADAMSVAGSGSKLFFDETGRENKLKTGPALLVPLLNRKQQALSDSKKTLKLSFVKNQKLPKLKILKVRIQ